MKMIKIDPPGTFCHYEAVFDMIKKCGGSSFVEVGCGAGDLSKKLCKLGLKGYGVDFSEAAILQARENLAEYIENGQYELIHDDLENVALDTIEKVDLGLSMMVMEHVEDEQNFIKQIKRFIKPGGYILLAVPGRKDRWSFEDETVGHLRRYDRHDLCKVMNQAGLEKVDVWSISVPTANLLFRIGDFLVKSSSEKHKVKQDQRSQTQSSGIREIPFKTVFPSFFQLILNRITLYPLFVIQRLFYRTNLGLEMLGVGKVVGPS